MNKKYQFVEDNATGDVMDVCVWDMGSPCEGTPREMASFAGQLQVPMCSRHRAEHMVVLYLNNNPEEVIKALNKEEDASVIDLLMDCSAEKKR